MSAGVWFVAVGLAAGPPPDMRAAADGANRFTCDLYAQALGAPGSLFLSPFSVQQAFAMLVDGAAGDTRAELVKTLHLPADPAAVGDLGRSFAVPGKPYELRMANALWGQKGYPWRPGFADRQRERFGAGVFVHDFRTAPEAGRTAVNEWVAGQTAGRIRELLSAGALDDRTRLVLANAVYFNAKWAAEFKPADTRDEPFTRADGAKAPVPIMRHKNEYRHAQLDGFQVLELPYAGGDVSMVVVLPADPVGLPAVEARFTADALAGWVKKLDERPVELYLPRFTLAHAPDLRSLLRAAGLTRVFNKKLADLSGLITELPPDDGPLYVGGAYHKALVEVGETGTVAAAVSGGAIGANLPGPAPREPVVFRAARPFLFLIRDMRSGAVLFVGRYAGP